MTTDDVPQELVVLYAQYIEGLKRLSAKERDEVKKMLLERKKDTKDGTFA